MHASVIVNELCHVLEDALRYALPRHDLMQDVSKVGLGEGSNGRGNILVGA